MSARVWFDYHSLTQHALMPLWRRVPERARWRIVSWLDKSPAYCWADLVDAALPQPDSLDDACDGRLPTPGGGGERCRTVCGFGFEHSDHADCRCYCGKFTIEPGSRHVMQAWQAGEPS